MRSKLDESSPSIARLALLLAAFLGLIVVGLNLIAPRPLEISQEQFLELIEQGAVASVEISDRTLHCVLVNSMEFDRRGRRVFTEQVSLDLDSTISIAEIEARGVAVSHAATAKGDTDNLWLTVVVGLLGVGFWYLFTQARHNLRHGSPRQQLRELEAEFRDGRMSRDEYEKQAAEISTDV